MKEYTLLRGDDVRTMLRLINELHEYSGRPVTWKRRLLDTVCPLVEAPTGIFGLAGTSKNGDGSAELGLERFRRDEVLRVLDESAIRALFAASQRRDESQGTVLDQEVSRGILSEFQRVGIGRFIASARRLGDSGWGVLLLAGPAAGPRFTPRHREIVHLVHGELGPMYARELRAMHALPDGRGLTPRLQQTLDLLLAGESEKTVAKRLSLSPHTVHVHVRSLYRRYQVNSRPKLLSRVLSVREPIH